MKIHYYTCNASSENASTPSRLLVEYDSKPYVVEYCQPVEDQLPNHVILLDTVKNDDVAMAFERFLKFALSPWYYFKKEFVTFDMLEVIGRTREMFENKTCSNKVQQLGVSKMEGYDRHKRMQWVLSSAWDTCTYRIATGRIKINKESSLQLHYAYILTQYGELACIEKDETFNIELETHHAGKNIDIWCAINDEEAAIELKCFRKKSNRATDTDMYDVLKDLSRLESYTHVAHRRFICLTDNEYYTKNIHSGHAGSVSTGNGVTYKKNVTITPKWSGTWKDKSRDGGITLLSDVEFIWNNLNEWYYLYMEI